MRTKVLTPDCPSCKKLIIDDNSNFQCTWGDSKEPKILVPHKGKKPKFCRLKR
jgi:hypothetical protein